MPDYYGVYKDPINSTLDFNVLMCKLSCKSDVLIDAVKKVEWSESEIYVHQIKNNVSQYFVVRAKASKLKCCNGDTTIGPMTLMEFESKVKELGLPRELDHSKTF